MYKRQGGVNGNKKRVQNVSEYTLVYSLCAWLFTGDWGGDKTEIPCCDVKRTSTGSMRTLAAGLAMLNCPEIPPPRAPVVCDPPHGQFDLSHFSKDSRLVGPASACKPANVSRPTACVSRAERLVRFNEAYNAAAAVPPDLRLNVRSGKRHRFTDNIHSQVLRGSTLSQA